MALLSKLRSSASVNLPDGSPRKRICKKNNHISTDVAFGPKPQGKEKGKLTPLLPWGSRESAQALVLYDSSVNTRSIKAFALSSIATTYTKGSLTEMTNA